MKFQSRNINVIVSSFLISLVYAILRYNIFKEVPWTDLPIYILNKAVALTIIILIFYNLVSKNNKSEDSKYLWIAVFFLTILHVLLSSVILIPEYFGKFYNGNKLNLTGSISLLAGIFAFLGFIIKGVILYQGSNKTNVKNNSPWLIQLKYLNHLFIGVHLFVMGFLGWFTPSHWPGWLPPISLLAFLLLILSTLMYRSNARKI